MGDWWLIPVLVLLVVAGERLYSVCRRHFASRGGSVDSSQFSALQTVDTADGMDDEADGGAELIENGLSDSETDERHHTTHNGHSAQQPSHQQQQKKQTSHTASK